jgi:hypothetical protein
VYRADDLVHLFSPVRRRGSAIAAEDQVQVATVASGSILTACGIGDVAGHEDGMAPAGDQAR